MIMKLNFLAFSQVSVIGRLKGVTGPKTKTQGVSRKK